VLAGGWVCAAMVGTQLAAMSHWFIGAAALTTGKHVFRDKYNQGSQIP